EVVVFHEDAARNARDNLNNIINFHNSQKRDLDVSIHFNAVDGTRDAGIGVETCYREGNKEMRTIAARISKAISDASGLILRRGDGTFARSDLGFLNRTNIDRAVLLEVCFVNSRKDVQLYQENFDAICKAIAEAIADKKLAAANVGAGKNSMDYPTHGLLEATIQAFIRYGIINSPDYWRSIKIPMEINGFLHACVSSNRLRSDVNNGINDFRTALRTLDDVGLVECKELYCQIKETARDVEWFDRLLINIANRL
ncbi:MAG: N-acetylmuramoyl-L-alanine amidase, partial [Defluviitaleaceae bacterium]|nr:N-acetylmuramoyl-L-alanine amidase [Defluviitaleaceae bacterium]